LTVPPDNFKGTSETCRLEAGGTILHGSIVDGERVIDEVVVGCEGENEFVIHCHGNPLLVEQIMTLWQSEQSADLTAWGRDRIRRLHSGAWASPLH
jgi:hypothetical protein